MLCVTTSLTLCLYYIDVDVDSCVGVWEDLYSSNINSGMVLSLSYF